MSFVDAIVAARRSPTRKRLTASTLVSAPQQSQGKALVYVPREPVVLVAEAARQAAGISLEEYSLARMAASEGYDGAGEAARAMAYAVTSACAVNKARRRKVTITGLLVRSTWGPPLDGHYGEQSGRWASTRNDPYTEHVVAARAALAGEVEPFAQGGDSYVAPVGMDRGLQAGRKLKYDAIAWLELMESEGKAPVYGIPLLDPYALMIWAPTPDSVDRAARVAWGRDVILKGRKGIRSDGGALPGATLVLVAVGVAKLLGFFA